MFLAESARLSDGREKTQKNSQKGQIPIDQKRDSWDRCGLLLRFSVDVSSWRLGRTISSLSPGERRSAFARVA